MGQIQQDGGCRRSADVLAFGLSATEGSESKRQVGKVLEVQAASCDGEAHYWKEASEKALEEEETARSMEELKDVLRAAPRRRRPQARVPTLE